MNVEELIIAMRETKDANQELELSDILQMYHIAETQSQVDATIALTDQIRMLRISNGR